MGGWIHAKESVKTVIEAALEKGVEYIHVHVRSIHFSGGEATGAKTCSDSFDFDQKLDLATQDAHALHRKLDLIKLPSAKGANSHTEEHNASQFFATIATNLVVCKLGMLPGIRKGLDEDPAISERVLKDQFGKLILQPLLGIKQACSQALAYVIMFHKRR
jgi:hypothetical protein